MRSGQIRKIEQFLADDEGPGLAVTIFDLVKTFQGVLERAKNRPHLRSRQRNVSVPEMMQFLRHQLERPRRQDHFPRRSLFERQRSSRAMICSVSGDSGICEAASHRAYARRGVRRHRSAPRPGFDESHERSEDLASVEQEYH